MGKRKSRKAAPKLKKKTQGPLPSTFKCPFCNHENSVECKIDREKSIGVIRCTVCDASYQMITNSLSEPIDVYSEWLDQCEAENDAVAQPDE